ncbi:reverse transcriptase domain-containing protein [Tanacetum coccineum]|uniref:Reverse transcriptase domain-containing protein n=1 Tax=Tanacetum coccineum TaxID=301880 RepID=A0ABQ5J7J7_9ASTR
MMTRAFISGLRPGRFFKDLISWPPASMEDLFTQAHNFIRVDEANTENRLRDSRIRPNERPNVNNSSFTPLIKSPAKIYATSEGKAVLRPPSRMFAPAHRRDRARYCEFYNDHGHDTNDCIDMRKEIEACIKSGRLSHLAKGAKTQNSNQNPSSLGASERGKNQIDWKQKMVAPKETNEILMMSTQRSPLRHQPDASPPGTNIAFSEEDPIPKHCNGEDPLIIKAEIGRSVIHRVYVDGGNPTEIMYEHCFQQLTNEAKTLMRSPTSPLIGFAGQVLWPLGVINIPSTLFDYNGRGSKMIITDFMIVRAPSPYNVILGRPGMRHLGAIASTIHSLLKFTISTGVAIVRGDIPCKDECLQVSQKREREPEEATTPASPENESEKEEMEINSLYPDQKFMIDMTGIPRELAEHRLNIHPRTFPVRQKKRVLAQERNDAINQEVIRLVEARILREVYFPRWVANPVIVRKNDGTWRMCIDFTNLNKACPKDSYPLPKIDQKIESLEFLEFKCFLDAYKGYHQIRMAEEDEEKTAFHTEHRTFYIEETFHTLRRINMKLNPKKCVFGVETGQFLGHMITRKGIEANPEKVKAIVDMVSPRTIREVQSLNGKLAALGRFLAKSAKKALAFFKTLKGCMNKNNFQWTQEAELAFQKLKQHLQSLPALTVPTPGETLILYLAVSHETISSLLMAERENVQKPIYFVSKALQGPKINYPPLEKLALALVHTARRLRRYFQAHTICVLTNQPIRQVLLKPENFGRLAKWAIELGEHDIRYKPRSAMKGQGSGAGLILTDPDGNEITYALRFEFPASNNEAEYEALIAGLELAIKMEVHHLQVFSDSLLVTNHVKGSYEAREESMKRYLAKVLRLQENFESFSITQVPRSRNRRADALSKLASSSFAHLTKKVLVEVIPCRSTEAAAVNVVTESEVTWMNPIIEYLKDGRLPDDPTAARKIRIKAPQYSLKHGILYRKGYLAPWLRCIGPNQAQYVLQEVHFRSCGAHAGARAIAQKAARLGYYWPTMYQDATHIVSTCRNCQEHAPILRKTQYDMTSIYSPCHRYSRPFPRGTGESKVPSCCNRLLHQIGGGCTPGNNHGELNIKQQFTSVAHPQANGQTEVTNRTLIQGLKTRLGKSKGQWVEELSNVLWAYRTTAKAGNNCTPYSLVYGSDAVLP